MSRIRGKDTGIEMRLRKALTEKGLHYRLYSNKIYGHPDIAFPSLKIAIFCDSEFWHGYHFEENKEKIHTNLSYWIPKIERNIARDIEVNNRLKEEGYLVLRYWGKEIETDLDRVVKEIMDAISIRKATLAYQKEISSFTTLGYIEKGDSYLLLYRNKKKNDVNEGKWIGVGGHLEKGETPLSCLKREVKEETGLDVLTSKYLGKIDFLNLKAKPERMYLYKIVSFSGELIPCNEGKLSWVKKEEMDSLPMWYGDRYFLPLLEKTDARPFRMTLYYDGDVLVDRIGPIYKKEKKAKKHAKRNHHKS